MHQLSNRKLKKKILSLYDLEKFYSKYKKSKTFSAEESGYQLAVHVPMQFSTVEDSDDGTAKFYSIRAYHLDRNRNGSSVPKSAADKAMKTMAYKPVLANFITYTDPDTGESIEDFTSHDFVISDDDTVEYLEHQIGCFTADAPYYEEADDKTYICAKICIPNEYTSANAIIERKGGTKMSVELLVNELQYNARSKVLELTDITVQGITCLGTKLDADGNPVTVEEGMKGAGISLEDFSTNNNSVFSHIDENDTNKLFELLSSINSKLDKFEDIENNGKEDIQVEMENENNTVDEEVTTEEVTTEEVTDESTEEVTTETEEEVSETVEDTPADDTDVTEDETTTDEFSADPMVRKFEISHEDVRYALYELLAPYEEEDNQWYYIEAVYDSYFVYGAWDESILYRQPYAKDGDNVVFDGERVHLNKEYLTDSELVELNSMRANYASIQEKAAKYDYDQLEKERMAEFDKEDYKSIADKKEFTDLAKEENHKDFSLDELKSKLDDIILAYAKGGQLSFAATEPTKKVTKVTRLPIETKSAKRSRYGNLFSK